MALVINSQPDTISSVYRPLCWDVTTDDVSVIKVKVEHIIDGSTVATTFHLPTLGTTDNFVIDASNIASNFVTYDLPDTYGGALVTFNSETNYRLNIIEIDNNFDELDVLLTPVINAQNIPLQHNETQDLVGKTLLDNTICILSNLPQTSTIYTNQVFPVNVLNGSFEDSFYEINTFLNGSPVSTELDEMINNANRSVFSIDTSLPLFDNIDKFDFTIYNDGLKTTQISKTYCFNLKQSCDNHCEVHYLNCMGGFDSFMFTGDKSTKFDVKRKRFKSSIGKGFDIKDRGQSVLGTKSTKEIELHSRFLNEGEANMLADLIHSPEVFLIEDGNYTPMVVKDGSFTTSSTKGLIQFKVVLQYANNKIIACV